MDLIGHRRIVFAVWVLVLIAAVPAFIRYGDYVNYSTTTAGLSHTESAYAQRALSKAAPQNDTLLVVINTSQIQGSLANDSLSFQEMVQLKRIPYVSSTSSAYSAYAMFVDQSFGRYAGTIRSVYFNMSSAAASTYSYPASFYKEWSKLNFSTSGISYAERVSAYNATPYEQLFMQTLNHSLELHPTIPPQELVQEAVQNTSLRLFYNSTYLALATQYLNFTDYQDQLQLANVTAQIISEFYGSTISSQLVLSAVHGGDIGRSFVEKYGLSGAPSFIIQQYFSPDKQLMLIQINFNVTSDYRGPNNLYPSENDTPELRSIAKTYFGGAAQLTGSGAITYDNQVATMGSGVVFALTFVFLAVAVAVALGSFFSPLLALVFVSIATVLGDVAIFLTGFLIVKVDFVVTYTLTAVILGVATDYLVFILSRYRDGLRDGLNSRDALKLASSKAGLAVTISGITVAASLGTFGFVSGLRSWGPVLFMAVMFTVALEVTLLPAIISLIGPRLFLNRSVKRREPSEYQTSKFYKAASLSVKRSSFVVLLIVLTALPCVYLWFNLPTTYDFLEGLPSSLPSVHALKLVESSFGSNLLYPDYIVFNLTQPSVFRNGTLTPDAASQITQAENYILDTPGVTKIVGPNLSMGTLTNRYADHFLFNNNRSVYFLVYTAYSPYSNQAIQMIKHIRDNQAFLVGGLTSSVVDQQAYYGRSYTILELSILVAIAIILGVSFRSPKYPLIALSGVFISITWTTALLYVVTKYLLHQELLYLIPLILYVILMSLGNDFTVFLISRIKEEQEKLGFLEGVLKGMVGSGTVVTALGLILAVSLGSLGLAPITFLRQLGIAFVISLVLDTFVIRIFYFPAMINMLAVNRKDGRSKRTV